MLQGWKLTIYARSALPWATCHKDATLVRCKGGRKHMETCYYPNWRDNPNWVTQAIQFRSSRRRPGTRLCSVGRTSSRGHIIWRVPPQAPCRSVTFERLNMPTCTYVQECAHTYLLHTRYLPTYDYVGTYVRTDLPASIHTYLPIYYIHTYIHRHKERERYTCFIFLYIHAYMHTYMHAYIHAYIHTCMHTYVYIYMYIT